MKNNLVRIRTEDPKNVVIDHRGILPYSSIRLERGTYALDQGKDAAMRKKKNSLGKGTILKRKILKTTHKVISCIGLIALLLFCVLIRAEGRHPDDGILNALFGSRTQKAEKPVEPPRLEGEYRIANVTVIDIDSGRKIFLGYVDLRPVLDRIAAGEKDAHRNDGTVFRNASRSLPQRPQGYYREYVIRTPGISGPGPQRLVLGKEGEIYYTYDHYNTFITVKGGT